jgi:predicted regulator of Ras-like GTPase activity (Roadblock/LC7/MglB family)
MAQLDQLMSTVGRNNAEAVAALLVDGAGRVQKSETTAPEVARAAIALATPLRELLDRTAAELGCGALRVALVEGTDASLAFADVDGDITAVLVGAAGAAPGALRADALWLADQVRAGGAS